MCLVQSKPAQQQDPGRYIRALFQRVHSAHLKAVYGTAALAALQPQKSIVDLVFMSRVNIQVSKCCCTTMYA